MMHFSRLKHIFPLSIKLCIALAWPLTISGQSLPEAKRPLVEVALPSLGDAHTQSLSPIAERKLGNRIMRSIGQDPQIIDDALIGEYIDTQWALLLNSARRQGHITSELDGAFAWKAFLVRDKNINAFALPGGYIGIHLGLIANSRSKDELASVLAHELSHVTQRHIARMMGEANRTSWVSMASMLLGAIAASRSPEVAQALIVGGQGLALQNELNFSRDMEREADRIGYGVLDNAGFAPEGMMHMFEQLQQAARLNDDNRFPYLRSHPLTVERIGEARSRMGNQDASPKAPNDAGLGLYHVLMAARSKVLMDPRSLMLEPFLKAPDSQLSEQSLWVHQYTRLLAATQLKDKTTANLVLAELSPLLRSLHGPDATAVKRLMQLSEIELLLETDRSEQALTLFKLAVTPLRPEALLFARAVLTSPNGENNNHSLWQTAASSLQTLTINRPDDATAWILLSALWQKMGLNLRALHAEAQASAARGDLQGAIDRVESARRRFPPNTPSDFMEQSAMDSHLREWLKTHKEDEEQDR